MVGLQKWEDLQFGDTWSGVVHTLVRFGDGAILGNSCDRSSRKVVVRNANLDPNVTDFVVINAKVLQVNPMSICEVGLTSMVVPMPPCEECHFEAVVELCSGLGVFSSMAPKVSLNLKVGVVQNGKWENLFKVLHPESQFVQGNIEDVEVTKKLLAQGLVHPILLAGISCQPHSQAGDKKGMADPRSNSLPAALQCIWLTQSPLAILECVPDIGQNKEAQSLLNEFCKSTGYMLTQQIINLQNSFPTRRSRWFAVLSCPMIGPVHIPDLPVREGHDKVVNVLPYPLALPKHEQEQLDLSLYELSKYHDYGCGGIEGQMIDLHKQLPTMLHSAANQLYPCRCGCHSGFSLARLQKKGLFGVLIPMDSHVVHSNIQMQQCRFMHPDEIFILHGGNVPQSWGEDLRLAVAGLGQSVSPIQSLWVLAHAKCCIQRCLLQPPLHPETVLEAHIAEVLEARNHLFPVHASGPPSSGPMQRPVEISVTDHRDESCIRFVASQGSTVADFKRAQSHLESFGNPAIFVEPWGEMVVDHTGEMANPLAPLSIDEAICIGIEAYQPHAKVRCLSCPCKEWPLDRVDFAKETISATVPFTIEEACQIPQDLLGKQGKAFLDIPLPKVTEAIEVAKLTSSPMQCQARQTLLQQQGDVWADDELRFVLSNICAQGPDGQNLVSWDPLLMTLVVQTCNFRLLDDVIKAIAPNQTIVTAVVIDKHWYPVMWKVDKDQVWAFTCGHACGFSVAINKIHHYMCKQLQKPPTAVKYHCLQFFVDAWCGAMASAYLEHLVWGSPVPTSIKDLKARHQVFREKFRIAIRDSATCPWTWGRGEQPWKHQLASLLVEHGVPQSEAQERTALVIDQLGEKDVLQALKHKMPWKELKWMASNRMPMVQLIKPSELEGLIKQRSQEGKPVGNRLQKKSKGKGKGKSPVANPKYIDPSVLRLETGVFVCNNTELHQITMEQVGPAASGVAFCRLDEAEPFIRTGRQISTGALAIIIVDAVLQPQATSLMAERVRIPALCVANSEPILIDGLLFQLGAQVVTRRVLEDRFEIVSVSTCVAKFLIFRDQVETSWDTIVAHPLKHLFAQIGHLQACTLSQCDGNCGAWHPSSQCDLPNPILELWGKQWISHGFSMTPADKADTFTVHMRLPVCLQAILQSFSGHHGIYVEPKEIDGKQPSGDYQVFWMPKSTYRELVHLRQTVEGICGLARLGAKHGVRCHISKAEGVHAAIRPEGSYLPQGKKVHYLIGPLPYGTLKTSVGQILDMLGWAARPLHPIAAASHISGVMWKLQAVDMPPQPIVQSDQGELLITRIDEPVRDAPSRPNVVAANHTLSLVTTQNANRGLDPLQLNDPWEVSLSKGVVQGGKGPIKHSDPVEVLEKRVVEAVLAQLPKPSMEVDSGPGVGDLDQKVAAMETQIQGMHDNQNKLHAMLCEQGQQQQAQITALQSQQTNLESAVAEGSSNLTRFQQTFQSQLEKQQNQLDELFQKQMDRIEDLFKKPRTA